jgi:hypothetical protein
MIKVQTIGYGLYLAGVKLGIITIIDILKDLVLAISGGKLTFQH